MGSETAGRRGSSVAVVLEEEPDLETRPELLAVLAELQAREPIFHRPEVGTSAEDLERQMAPDFWEVGASGRLYSRQHVLRTLLERFAHPHQDSWQTSDFHCRQVGADTYLLTYTLQQPDRLTRRVTVRRRTPEAGWQILFHQGTPVAERPLEDLLARQAGSGVLRGPGRREGWTVTDDEL